MNQNCIFIGLFQLQLPRFFRSIEIWLIAMGSGGNPPFAEELALHKVSLQANGLF